MGYGSWSASSYATYSTSVGRSYCASTKTFTDTYNTADQAFVSRQLDPKLDPKKVLRECCDSDEHPNTFPIILALDVTGSMGNTAIAVQKQLNPIMEEIYATVKDAEVMVMAIGDLAYDDAPIQISQFESDIRIAENLDKIYFENGGGGNDYESYTAAWYMGLKHCKLDCWKRGKKGLIITMGDEPINPYLPKSELGRSTGDTPQADIETKDLYKEAVEKFDLVHFCIESRSYSDQTRQKKTFDAVLGSQNVYISNVDGLHKKIIKVIQDHAAKNANSVELITESTEKPNVDENGDIFW